MPDPSGPGRVDMLTSPVAAARAAVAPGLWVKSKHDTYLIPYVEVWELKRYFYPSAEGFYRKLKKRKKKKKGSVGRSATGHGLHLPARATGLTGT